jgi:hypothetical protein
MANGYLIQVSYSTYKGIIMFRGRDKWPRTIRSSFNNYNLGLPKPKQILKLHTIEMIPNDANTSPIMLQHFKILKSLL